MGAIGATAVERQVMIFHNEAVWREAGHVAWTGMHIEDAVARAATEMVVVPMTGCLVARRLAGQGDRVRRAILGHQLQVAVHRGHAHVGHRAARLLQQFVDRQGPAGSRNGRLQCGSLAGKSFHAPIVSQPGPLTSRRHKPGRNPASHDRYKIKAKAKKTQSAVTGAEPTPNA